MRLVCYLLLCVALLQLFATFATFATFANLYLQIYREATWTKWSQNFDIEFLTPLNKVLYMSDDGQVNF